jgi:hypothetical protein
MSGEPTVAADHPQAGLPVLPLSRLAFAACVVAYLAWTGGMVASCV